jgi:hypothetical protein
MANTCFGILGSLVASSFGPVRTIGPRFEDSLSIASLTSMGLKVKLQALTAFLAYLSRI